MYSNIFISLIPFFIFCPQSFKKPWGQVRTVQLILVEKSYLVTYALFGSVHNGISVRFGQSQNFIKSHMPVDPQRSRDKWCLGGFWTSRGSRSWIIWLLPAAPHDRVNYHKLSPPCLLWLFFLDVCVRAHSGYVDSVYLTYQHWITETIF